MHVRLGWLIVLMIVVGAVLGWAVRSARIHRAVTQTIENDRDSVARESNSRGKGHATPKKTWPPPGFPLVEGDHPVNAEWSIHLPEKFARRVEDGSLVLWRPGLTIWLTQWNNDHGISQAERLAKIKAAAYPNRFAERETNTDNVTRFSYRLRDESEDGPVDAVYGFIISDTGQLQLAVYFDDRADEEKARQLVDGITKQVRARS